MKSNSTRRVEEPQKFAVWGVYARLYFARSSQSSSSRLLWEAGMRGIMAVVSGMVFLQSNFSLLFRCLRGLLVSPVSNSEICHET